jgi:hypothetical protein
MFKFNVIPRKFPGAFFFHGSRKNKSNIHMDHKRPGKTIAILRKNNKAKGVTFLISNYIIKK